MQTPTEPIVAVIQLRTQAPGVLHQVILRPDKVKGDIIRIGETPGDEANGWVRLDDVNIITVLGKAVEEKNGQTSTWKCVQADS